MAGASENNRCTLCGEKIEDFEIKDGNVQTDSDGIWHNDCYADFHGVDIEVLAIRQ